VHATNQGGKPLPLERVRYRVTSAGTSTPEMIRDANATLPAFGGRTLELPSPLVGVDPGGATPASDDLSVVAQVWYRQPGWVAKILFDLGVYRPVTTLRAPIAASSPEE